MLALQPVEPLLGAPAQVRLRLLCKRQKVLRVTPPQVLGLARLLELFSRVLADRLQHPVAVLRVAEQALVDKRLQRVNVRRADTLGSLECAAATEDGKPEDP